MLTFRYLLPALWLLTCCRPLAAQQEQQYTQFMFNKMAFNPGYAGSFESPTLVAVYRGQWLGLEGAPSTQLVSYNQPLLNNRIGLGGNLVRNSIGISSTITMDLAYAYRIEMRRGALGVGLQASMRQLRQDWTDERLRASQPILTDGAIPMDLRTKVVPNFGFGVFYTGNKWYIGGAIPRLVQNNIDLADFGGILSREERHFNAMGGVSLDVASDLEFTPQLLLKFVKNAPFDADINLSLLVKRKFYGGLTYRVGGDSNNTGESLDIMSGFQATKNLFFSVSYDIGISSLRKYHNGSVEAVVRWWFNVPEGEEIVDPRYPW